MRDPELTRQKILEVAAEEIHQSGFKNTSLSTILNRCEISKGALYHHFSNKTELGYAVLEEIYTPDFLSFWRSPLLSSDPIESLCEFFAEMPNQMSCEEVANGCPLHNLCQEMSADDEGFRIRILSMQQQLNALIANALRGISDQLKSDLDYNGIAYLIVSAINGANIMSKSTLDKAVFEQVLQELCRYLRSLKK